MKSNNLSDKRNVPQHIAIIMDGNRRWAKKKGLPTLEGHKQGREQFQKISRACRDLGVKILTVYAFSSENWKRSKKEVNYLMNLLADSLKSEEGFFQKNGIKFNPIGEVDRLPKKLRDIILRIVEETKNNKKGILNLALSYGGRNEIVSAVRKIIESKIKPRAITEKVFSSYLYTAGQEDPDLVIRTSGEFRTSNFLPWQSTYAEYYFSKKYWPDFTVADLKKAIAEYQKRNRRIGK